MIKMKAKCCHIFIVCSLLMFCIMLSFVKKYNSLSVRPIATLLTKIMLYEACNSTSF